MSTWPVALAHGARVVRILDVGIALGWVQAGKYSVMAPADTKAASPQRASPGQQPAGRILHSTAAGLWGGPALALAAGLLWLRQHHNSSHDKARQPASGSLQRPRVSMTSSGSSAGSASPLDKGISPRQSACSSQQWKVAAVKQDVILVGTNCFAAPG